MNTLNILHAVFKKDLKNAISYKVNFIFGFFGIFAASFVFFHFSKLFAGSNIELLEEYGNNYFLFVIFGIAITDISFLISRSISNELRQGQLNGNLEEILISGAPPIIVLIGSTLFPLIFGLLRFFVYIIVAKYLYDLNEIGYTESFLLILLLAQVYISFVGIALISAAFTIYFKKGDPVNTLIFALNSVFAGLLFPTTALPKWGEFISLFIPTTYSIEISRGLLIQNNLINIYSPIMILSIISIFLLTSGIIITNKVILATKLNGTIIDY